MIDKNLVCFFVLCLFTSVFFSFKMLAVFQQCGYKTDEFFMAIFGGKKREIIKLSTYSAVLFVFLMLANLFLVEYNTSYCIFVVVISSLTSGVYFVFSKTKKRVKFTNRCLRIFIFSVLSLCALCCFFVVFAQRLNFKTIRCLPLFLIPLFIPLFLVVGKFINYPYDAFRYNISKRLCKKRLAKNKNLIKIGITGSCGKTSVKNYLEKMLKTKYRVLATPLSYNTPLGICKTVKKDVLNYDLFIAELGARRKNDVKELCKMVEPQIGIITSILPQHTKTLGGIDGVKNAKFQLIEGLCGEKTGFFYNDLSYLYDLYKRAKCNKVLVGEGGEVYFQNAEQKSDGIEFELVVGNATYKTFTPLLGLHNLKNICIATAVALYLKVEINNILCAIQNLAPPKHRAEIIKNQRGVTIIDDSYNANIEGIKSTAQAMDVFKGNKIAVTSGIVELGKEYKDLNFEVGKILAQSFSTVIVMGVNAQKIKDGVQKEGGTAIFYSDMQKVKDFLLKELKKGDVVVFFSDLPDVYGI